MTNVVGLGAPFQLTTKPFTKSVPLTVSVNPLELQNAVEAGDNELNVGATIGNATAPDVPPPGGKVNTVTCAVPSAAISAAVTAALSCVALTNVVGRLLPFHRTTEQGTNPAPVTFKVNAAVPAVALVGTRVVTDGTGRDVVGAVTANGRELEIAAAGDAGLDTVMDAFTGNAASLAEICAVSCVALTKVVGRGDPFQFTAEPFTKFVPFTVSVNPVAAQ